MKLPRKEIEILKNGGVGIFLTDTLYGLVGQAFNKNTVSRIYKIKNRDTKKPLIILISSIKDLKKFKIKINSELKVKLEEYWPGPVSIILPCPEKEFKYLHRGTKNLAFRFPQKESLVEILKETGPLVAPSANPENLPPAQNIKKAKEYFENKVDFYLRGSRPKNKPSNVIKINNENIEVIRK